MVASLENGMRSELLWATPTLRLAHPSSGDLNRALARIILEKEREIIGRGNATPVAGLESGLTTHWLDYNVLNWDYPEVAALREFILSGYRQYLALVGDPADPGY